MKIRTGFVSNSSSSSFIVEFKTKPKNSKETRKAMFGDKDMHEGYSTKKIAKAVFSDIKEQGETALTSRGNFTLKTSYSDNDGDFWSMMEHSDIFYNLEHERQSNH